MIQLMKDNFTWSVMRDMMQMETLLMRIPGAKLTHHLCIQLWWVSPSSSCSSPSLFTSLRTLSGLSSTFDSCTSFSYQLYRKQKLFSRIVMGYLINLAISYILTTVEETNKGNVGTLVCTIRGYLAQYFFLVGSVNCIYWFLSWKFIGLLFLVKCWIIQYLEQAYKL